MRRYKRYARKRKPMRYKRKKRTFRKGYNRTSGFYGRFNNSKGLELKFHDKSQGVTNILSSAVITQLLDIAQGTTQSQRIGRKCTIKSIGIRYTVTIPTTPSLSGGADLVRVMLILDKQANGAPLTATQILESDAVTQYRNLVNSSRFTVLWDKSFIINATAGGGNGTISDSYANKKHLVFFKKLNLPIEYDGTDGAITEIRSNNLTLLQIGLQGTSTSVFRIRIRFMG